MPGEWECREAIARPYNTEYICGRVKQLYIYVEKINLCVRYTNNILKSTLWRVENSGSILYFTIYKNIYDFSIDEKSIF